jgi:hypothetical protein
MGNLIGGLLILIVLVALMFGVLAGASNGSTPRRRPSMYPRGGMAPRPTFGHWQAPTPRPPAHPYYEGLKKNQGGWRWQ